MDRKTEKPGAKAPAAGDRVELLKRALLKIESLETRLAAAESVKNEPIAIVGMACRLPAGANDPQAFWRLLEDGVDAMTDPPPSRWNLDDYYDPDPEVVGKAYTMMGGFIEDVDLFDAPFFGISPREAEQMDPQQRWLMQTSWHALEDAGIAPETLFGTPAGVFVGMTGSDFLFLQTGNDSRNIDTYLASGTSHAVAAGRLSYALGLRGPAITIDTACSSALLAVHLACNSLRLGECDTALAGGVLLILSPDGYVSACKAQLLSPDGHCKTFDDSADGYARAEGCAMVTLKRLSDAQRDGDNVLAVIRGSASNQDGRSGGLTAPSGNAQEAVIKEALVNAGVAPADVSYVETHGTGTSLGDPIEVQALANVYSQERSGDKPLVIGSVKSNIGHTEGLAGVAGLIKLVLALQYERIPGDLHFNRPNSHIPWADIPLVVADKLYDWPEWADRKIGGVSSFGFSGTNVHMLVEQAPPTNVESSELERPRHILTLSARREAALDEVAELYAARMEEDDEASVADICYAANTGRNHFEYRAAVTGETREELLAGIRRLASDEPGGAIRGAKVQPHGTYSLAFLFPGEGSQYVGMGRELFETQPVFRRVLTECERLLDERLERPLLSVLYPQDKEDTKPLLDESRYAQPAMFALAWALVEMWESFGVTPAVVAGHGVGELAAACAAGIVDFEEGLLLAAERGRLFSEFDIEGAMAVAHAAEARVRSLIEGLEDVCVASVNAADSVVIAGAPDAVSAAADALKNEQIEVRPIASGLALQSPGMKPLASSIAEAAGNVRHGIAHVDFVSMLTGKLATGQDGLSPGYWGDQVTSELRFADAMRTVRSRGCRAFVEIGPRGSLLAMARRSMSASSLQWLPSLTPGQDDWRQTLDTLSHLYVDGANVDWQGFDSGYARRKVTLPTYPFERQVYEIKAAKPSWTVENVDAYLHPLAGQRLNSPRIPDLIWESRLDSESGLLDDYRYFDCPIVPAGAFVDAALTAAAEALPEQALAVRDFAHDAPLAIGDGVIVQTVASAPAEDTSRVETFSRRADAPDGDWTAHGRCTIEVSAKPAGDSASEEQRSEWESRCRDKIPGAQFYEQLVDGGLNPGASFRVIDSLSRCDGEAVASMRIPAGDYASLLEACSHVVQAALPGMPTLRPGVPLVALHGFERFRLDADRPDSLYAHVTIRSEADEAAADVRLYDSDGREVGELTGVTHGPVAAEAIPLADERRMRNWLYGIDWEEADAPAAAADAARHWVVLADRGGQANNVSELLAERGEHVSVVTAAKAFANNGDGGYTVDPDSEEDLVSALTAAREARPDAALSILHFWGLEGEPPKADDRSPGDGISSACHRLLNVARAAVQVESQLTVVTQGAQPVSGNETAALLAQAPLVGIQRVLANEAAELRALTIDLDPQRDAAADGRRIVAELASGDDGERQIAYRGGKRFIARFDRRAYDESAEPVPKLELGAGGYLVTGGLGGIGLSVADWLVRRGARHLFLMGRSGASEQAQKRIAEFEAAGAKVQVVSADVGDAEQLRSAFDTIDDSGVPLRGVFHAAGVLDDALLSNQDLARVEKVMRPKVDGSWNLHTLTADRDLDFFVLFSAGAAVFGNPGQTNYAAANLFLDALAHHRQSLGLSALSINWGAWAEVGMAASLGSTGHSRWAQLGVGDIAPHDGTDAMELAILTSEPQLAVMPINWVQWRRAFPGGRLPPFTSRLMQATGADAAMTGTSIASLREHLASADEERGIHLGEYVTRQLAVLLGLVPEEIDMKQPVSELGFDSLMATNLKTRIEADLSIDVPVAALLDGPNSHDLVDRLLAVFDQTNAGADGVAEGDDSAEWEEGAL